jgi:putative tricarboxylic transport membrane protein
VERKLSKHPEKFGTGAIEGVAAPEACNNATASGLFIPLLSLGIPGSAAMALFLGALMIYGLQPGPLLIKNHPDVFWGVVASMYVGNAMLLVLNIPLIPLWVKVLKIPYYLLFPMIFIFCIIGSYTLHNDIGDVVILITFGIIGHLLMKYGFDIPPLILAFVLGRPFEMEFRRSLSLSRGSFSIFFTRPISLVFVIVGLAILMLPFLTKTLKDLGFPEVLINWSGFFAPAKIPEDVKKKLVDALDKALGNPQTVEKLKKSGFCP